MDASAVLSLAPLDRLFGAVYGELLRIAHGRLSRATPTLDTVAIVNEAYARLQRAREVEWTDQAHVRAVACHAMRQVVRNYLRDQARLKRGGGTAAVTLDGVAAVEAISVEDMLDLDAALGALEVESPRLARIVEMRYFGGLSIEEVADALQVGSATVKRDWQKARLFLGHRLGSGLPEGG